MLPTVVCAGVYRLSVSMGNQFLRDYSATVGPISMISTADSHETNAKNNPLAHLWAPARKKRIACIANVAWLPLQSIAMALPNNSSKIVGKV